MSSSEKSDQGTSIGVASNCEDQFASNSVENDRSHRGVAVEAPLPVDFGIRLAFTLASSSQEEAGRRLDVDRPYFYAGRRFQEALALMLEPGAAKKRSRARASGQSRRSFCTSLVNFRFLRGLVAANLKPSSPSLCKRFAGFALPPGAASLDEKYLRSP